jgi:hypothetical protein
VCSSGTGSVAAGRCVMIGDEVVLFVRRLKDRMEFCLLTDDSARSASPRSAM